MKTTHLFFSIIAIYACLISCTQNEKVDCESALNEKFYRAKMQKHYDKDSLKRDYDILMECGNLDSVDAEIFTSSYMNLILLDLHNRERRAGKITYKRGLEIISDFKKEWKDYYKPLYAATVAQMELEHIKVNLAEFEKIRPKLIKSGIKADIEPFKTFLEKNKKNWTYAEALEAFSKSQTKM